MQFVHYSRWKGRRVWGSEALNGHFRSAGGSCVAAEMTQMWRNARLMPPPRKGTIAVQFVHAAALFAIIFSGDGWAINNMRRSPRLVSFPFYFRTKVHKRQWLANVTLEVCSPPTQFVISRRMLEQGVWVPVWVWIPGQHSGVSEMALQLWYRLICGLMQHLKATCEPSWPQNCYEMTCYNRLQLSNLTLSRIEFCSSFLTWVTGYYRDYP